MAHRTRSESTEEVCECVEDTQEERSVLFAILQADNITDSQSTAQAGNASLFYDFEEQALQRPAECGIWYRQSLHHSAVEYTLSQVYDNSLRYAALLLDLGLAPGDLVASYLMNSPEFIFKTLGCWAIGCAPAEINYNLADASLLHCLKISGSRVLIADADSECLARIEAVRSRIEGELGMRIIVLDEPTTGRISNYPVTRPADALRAKVAATDPAFIFYTSGTTGMPKGKVLVAFPVIDLTSCSMQLSYRSCIHDWHTYCHRWWYTTWRQMV